VGQLQLADLPVLAAPMAGGPSTPELVAAAAAAGSLGFVPAGYRSAIQLAEDLAVVRTLTPAYGVNLFVPDPTPVDRAAVLAYRDLIALEIEALGAEVGPLRWRDDDDDWDAKIELLVAEPAPWVSFTFGLPDAHAAARLRRAGSRLLMTVTDVHEARAAAALEPDGLVVQSAAAGGHRGTFDQRLTPDTSHLPDLVRAVLAATGLPVVAAGGLSSTTQVTEVLTAGADAVQVGTALLLADEAATKPTHRRALSAPDATSVTMRAYTGRVARGIKTGFSARYDAAAPPAYPAVHHLTAPLRRWAAAHDDADHLHLWAGTGHRSATSGPVAELVAALVP
jgi:NAD(P)H-dependent flavin oxidoreductase YrpB (nitropropane dioxygenase family)